MSQVAVLEESLVVCLLPGVGRQRGMEDGLHVTRVWGQLCIEDGVPAGLLVASVPCDQ